MRPNQVAGRYARALFNLVRETGETDVVTAQMQVVKESLGSDVAFQDFIASPLYRPADKVKVMEAVTAAVALNDTLKRFLLLLARKNRLGIFAEVLSAFQSIADEANGITRGAVRSATALGPDERARITELVGAALKKKVILTFHEDSSLLGGMVAEVGSFTFDDSLKSHLNRINEQLTRSVH